VHFKQDDGDESENEDAEPQQIDTEEKRPSRAVRRPELFDEYICTSARRSGDRIPPCSDSVCLCVLRERVRVI